MDKVIKFIHLYFMLRILELIIIYLLFLKECSTGDCFDYFYFRRAYNGILYVIVFRVEFYCIHFLLMYNWLFKHVKRLKFYTPLLFSLFNTVIYILFCYLSKGIFGTPPLPPDGTGFWWCCIAIFLSPLILGQIPHYKNLMKSL